MKRILILMMFATVNLRAEVQFTGFFITDNESLFTLSDTDSRESSEWLRVGESFHALTVRSFDREHEIITVETGGQPLHLHLRDSRVKDGRMTIDGTITMFPGNKAQGVHASLFLGEDQAFPLKGGTTLHLTVERQSDGNLVFHARFVIRDKDGKETSDSWPSIVTAPGGEFSIRNGGVGFSFKP